MKKRIGELDALRGICILGMIYVHYVYDLIYLAGKTYPGSPLLKLMGGYGHLLFLLISGISATFSTSGIRRGLQVFSAGLLVSWCTLFADLILGLQGVRIWFGILHLLGISMLCYAFLKKMPVWGLTLTAGTVILLGGIFSQLRVSASYLFFLGLCREGMDVGSDFFPVFPNLGWFLLGAVLGRTLYSRKQSLLPWISWENYPQRFLCLCGRHSLLIYLLHQPVLLLFLL